MNEDKATRYHRLRRRAHVASVLVAGSLLIGLTLGGGGVWLRDLARAVADAMAPASTTLHWAIHVACTAGLLTVLLEAVTLPAHHYAGFVLERRYGLSRQAQSAWWRDHGKGVLLGLALAVVLALVVYGALAGFPRAWWLVSGLAIAGLGALLVVGAPVVLLPLFYRFRPVDDRELADTITRLARRAGAPVLGVYEWSLGDKTRAANAALVGIGPTRRVLLSDTLLAEYSPAEIEVVIAHELAHHVHGDIWQGVLVEGVQGMCALLASHLALSWWGAAAGVASPADLAGLPLLATAAGVWSIVTTPLPLALSRWHERRADRFALELTQRSDAFISALRRLGAQNLADDEPPRIVEWLFHSHPPLNARVSFARQWAADHQPAALSA